MGAHNYRIAGGQRTGDNSTTGAVVAGVAGMNLSLRSATFNASTAAVNLILEEQTTGTDLVGPIYLPINGSITIGPFEPGALKLGGAGNGLFGLASGASNTTFVAECYVM